MLEVSREEEEDAENQSRRKHLLGAYSSFLKSMSINNLLRFGERDCTYFSNILGILHMGSKEIYERSLAQGFGIPNMKTKGTKRHH